MRHAPSSSQPQREPREHGREAGEEQSRNAGTEKERSTKTRLIRNNKGTFLQIQQFTQSLPTPTKTSIRKYLEDFYAYRKIKVTQKIKTPRLAPEENQTFPTGNTPAPRNRRGLTHSHSRNRPLSTCPETSRGGDACLLILGLLTP